MLTVHSTDQLHAEGVYLLEAGGQPGKRVYVRLRDDTEPVLCLENGRAVASSIALQALIDAGCIIDCQVREPKSAITTSALLGMLSRCLSALEAADDYEATVREQCVLITRGLAQYDLEA